MNRHYKVNGKSYKLPAMKRLEARLGPAEKWAGQCYAIATGMVGKGLIHGTPRYGHFLGEVDEESIFYSKHQTLGWSRHGWIECDKVIIDPTRWAFECIEPYIFMGPRVEFDKEYDVGGNAFRSQNMKPPPSFEEKIITGDAQKLPTGIAETVVGLGITPQRGKVSASQIHWLANLPPEMLGAKVRDVFVWIKKVKMGAMIPIDNQRLVLGG